MTNAISMILNDKEVKAASGKTILEVCFEQKVELPVMCYFEGLTPVGACRLCLVEIEGANRLLPACTTPAADGQKIRTDTEKLKRYRRMIVELFFSERNHICSVCVANRHCDLQNLGYQVGMDHVRFPYLFPPCAVDGTHEQFLKDDNRCIMCTRCVRVCEEIEGAHVWDVMGRGFNSRIISDLNEPWGLSETCTSCGKCIQVCPTGALWPKDAVEGTLDKHPDLIRDLARKRKEKS